VTGPAFNLLTEPLLHTAPDTPISLPGLLSQLATDEVESYPALRPHQAPAWHMFLVQLAALALHRAGTSDLPETEDEWAQALRGLTPEFPQDEPWCLVVEDQSKPAFLQPPIPPGVKVCEPVNTPDALDLLITSRNHDLKQAVAHEAEAEDWILALVSLQTSEGFGGAKNYGIVRMNGGSSSRPMLGLAPLPQVNSKSIWPRPGLWFRRDLTVLLATRTEECANYGYIGYPAKGGLGLTWIAPWPEGEQLTRNALDLWFIEVCRRVRISIFNGGLTGLRGTSTAPRIAAKELNGALGDPWAPVHRTENKSLTLSGGDFDYSRLVDLLFSGDWKIPLLAQPASSDAGNETMALVAQALSRGNSKTEGFKSRMLPVGGKVSRALGPKRKELHELAQRQIDEIAKFDKALRMALALVAAGGDSEKLRKEHYAFSKDACATLDSAVDAIFFEHLWARFEAQENGPDARQAEELCFVRELHQQANAIFEAALPSMPCVRLFWPRAAARARQSFYRSVRYSFPELFPTYVNEEANDVDA
jgi:CRISPR system Cascade subunit CasA